MRDLVVSTYTGVNRQPLAELLVELARAGHVEVEVLATPPHVDLEAVDHAVAELRPVLKSTGLRVTSVVPSGVDVNLASTHEGMRRWSRTQFLATARLGAELGAEYVLVHPGRRHPLRPPPDSQLRSWVLDGLHEIVEAADSLGRRVLLENVPTGLIDTGEECAAVAAEVPGLGLCYDVANGFMVEDPALALASLGERLELVHVSDTKRSRWLHDPLGTGEVAWTEVADALAERAYTGRVVLETLHDGEVSAGFARDAQVWRSAVESVV